MVVVNNSSKSSKFYIRLQDRTTFIVTCLMCFTRSKSVVMGYNTTCNVLAHSKNYTKKQTLLLLLLYCTIL